MSFANLGIAYRYDSQYDHAEASYQKAIQSDPDFYDAYFVYTNSTLQNKFQKGLKIMNTDGIKKSLKKK